MKRLFFVYIPVLIFSLTLVVNGLREISMEKETILPAQDEQLFESGNFVCLENDNSLYYQLGADEGITVPHGRRPGLNKLPTTSTHSYYNINSGKNTPLKLPQAKNERNFIQYLTTRHSQGFYIYAINELLL